MNIFLSSLRGRSHRVREPIVDARGGLSLTTVFAALAMAANSAGQTPPVSYPESHPVQARVTAATSEPIRLTYKSAFERYRSFRDEAVGSWRDANDTVTRVGGWREYLREAQRPEPGDDAAQRSPTQSTPPAPVVKPNPHADHGTRK
jgi:hypothetical protein